MTLKKYYDSQRDPDYKTYGDLITLFRAIPTKNLRSKKIGRWWGTNPYQSLTFHFGDGKG